MWNPKEPVTKESSQEKRTFWGEGGENLFTAQNLWNWCQCKASCRSFFKSTSHALKKDDNPYLSSLWIWLSFPFRSLILAHPLGQEGRLCRKIGHSLGIAWKNWVGQLAQLAWCRGEGLGARFCVAAPRMAVRFVSARHDRSALEILLWRGASCSPHWSVSLQSKITTCCRGSALGQTHGQVYSGFAVVSLLVWGWFAFCLLFLYISFLEVWNCTRRIAFLTIQPGALPSLLHVPKKSCRILISWINLLDLDYGSEIITIGLSLARFTIWETKPHSSF